MKAHAQVVAERQRERSRCTTLRSAPPLTFRVTPEGLHLVGTTAGPVGGDELTLEVIVGAGASLTIRSVAAQLVLPAPRPAASTVHLAIEVGGGADLRWRPEPTVVVRAADHRTTTVVSLAPDADLVWQDEVVLGRDGELGGSLLQRLRVERSGRPLLCTEVALGPVWPTSAGPAGTDAARVLATTLLVGGPARAALARGSAAGAAPAWDRGGAGPTGRRTMTGVSSAAYPLTDDAVLLTGLGSQLAAVRAAMVLHGAPGG